MSVASVLRRPFQAYARRSRVSLRWRLTASHLVAVFVAPAVLLLLGAAVSFAAAIIRGEDVTAAADAAGVARRVADGGLALGDGFPANSSVSLVALDGTIRDSSRATLRGQPIAAAGVEARTLFDQAARTKQSLERDAGNGRRLGASPVVDGSGSVTGVVVIDEPVVGVPSWGSVREGLFGFGLAALGLAGIFFIPGLVVASILGFRRARTVSLPVLELSEAAVDLADGNLSRRVVIRGEDEVAQLGMSFNTMADRLQSALTEEAAERRRAEALLAANRELVTNASHELRTPVAVVRAHLEGLIAEPANTAAYAAIAIRETDRLEQLVDDLFLLARLESDAVPVGRAEFDAAAAVQDAVDALAKPARREAKLALQADIAERPLLAIGDAGRVVQVLQNLIRNAIRYTPEGGIILVVARRSGDAVELQVRDTGAGIEAAKLEHVFDRFYRADTSRLRDGGGAGLGLAIAKDLVEAMGGSLTAESVVGEGSAFTIRLVAR